MNLTQQRKHIAKEIPQADEIVNDGQLPIVLDCRRGSEWVAPQRAVFF